MSTVEDRLSALESEVQLVKRQLATICRPRAWLYDVAPSFTPHERQQALDRLLSLQLPVADWPQMEDEIVRGALE